MVTVTLFTKDDCGLCEEVKADLAILQSQYPHQLHEVDITQDAALFNKYRYTIPVVKIANTELAAPITAVQLKNSLQQAIKQI